MRLIQQKDLRFVGEELQFRGGVLDFIKQTALDETERTGRAISANQVAEGLVSGIRQGVDVQATLLLAIDKLRRLSAKLSAKKKLRKS